MTLNFLLKGFYSLRIPALLLILLTAVSLFVATIAQAESDLFRISNYLNQQEAIRVWVSRAPGNGHQAATVNGMRRLRELGFRGIFEVVYSDGIGQDTTGIKLGYLIPGFNPNIKGLQNLNTTSLGQLKIVSEKEALELIGVRRVLLGFTGALEFIDAKSREEASGRRLLDLLNVDVVLSLQPRNWSKYSTRGIHFRHGRDIDLSDTVNLGIKTAAPTNFDLIHSIETELKSSDLEYKEQGLKVLVENLRQVDLMPIYGLGKSNSPDDFLGRAALALKYAQEDAPELFRRPILIPVFSEFDEVSRHNIEYTLKEEVGGIETFEISELHKLNRFFNQNKFSMAVVFVGRVPPTIFHGVFARASLPSFVAGKNLVSFVAELGLPFLSTVNTEGKMDIIHDIENRSPYLQERLRGAHEAMISTRVLYSINRSENPEALELSRFLIDLRKPHSELRAYFQSLAQNKENISQDLLFESLKRLESNLNESFRVIRECSVLFVR